MTHEEWKNLEEGDIIKCVGQPKCWQEIKNQLFMVIDVAARNEKESSVLAMRITDINDKTPLMRLQTRKYFKESLFRCYYCKHIKCEDKSIINDMDLFSSRSAFKKVK